MRWSENTKAALASHTGQIVHPNPPPQTHPRLVPISFYALYHLTSENPEPGSEKHVKIIDFDFVENVPRHVKALTYLGPVSQNLT